MGRGLDALSQKLTKFRLRAPSFLGWKLPSASTCFNTLKLPTYSSEKVMKKKIIMSITSGAGFELT